MRNYRHIIEKWFENLAHLIFRHRLKTILIVVIIAAGFISQIRNITIDTSTEGFLHDDDPALLSYFDFREQFGRDEVIIIAIKSPDIFSISFLNKLNKLHRELKGNVPHLHDIKSLINARNTRGEGDTLIVEDLLEKWPDTTDKMAVVKSRVFQSQMYKNLLVSEDGRFTTITIETHSHTTKSAADDVLEDFEDGSPDASITKSVKQERRPLLTDKENSQAVSAVQAITDKYQSPDFRIYLAGLPVVTHFLKRTMMQDMRKFMVMAILIVAVVLFIMFRKISGVILPLLIVILSLLTTIGIMALFGVPIKVPTQILPSFILAVGVGTSVHILAIFYHQLRKTNDKENAIAYALGHSGLAVVMTNVTTASGLMSFSGAEIAPLADMGIFAGVGVLLAFVYTILLLPGLLALMPITNRKTDAKADHKTIIDRFLEFVATFSTTHPYKILFFSMGIIIVSIYFITNIRFSHHPLHWLPEDNHVRIATEKIDHELRGSATLEMIVKTDEENRLYDPELLNRLERAAKDIEAFTMEDLFVGKAWSITTILKEINQALNENQPEFYSIPKDRQLVGQEFLLFENSGSDDLEDVVDSRFSMARLTIKVPLKDAVKYEKFLNRIEEYCKNHFPDLSTHLTGMILLLWQTDVKAIKSMKKSYAIALIVISLLMIVLIGRVRIGLLSMIPNLTPILLMLGAVGAFSMPMDLFTMMIASIAIGLAVDDTIHFMHNFRRYYEQSGDPKQAVHETLQSTGRAMLVTTIVLSVGFYIFAFATMKNVVNFGLLTGSTIIMALLSDYFIAPALMVIVNKDRSASSSSSEMRSDN